jgi:hypothetical protein
MKLPDFNAYINKKEILKETLSGLNKDFVQIGEGEPVDSSRDYTFEELLQALIPVIDELYCHRQQKLKNLINRVDLSESVYLAAISGKEGREMIEELTSTIIKRELQKAVLRRLYRG